MYEHDKRYTFYAELDRVVDGDTLDLSVDLGFGITKEIRVRLVGVDAPEMHGVKHESEEYREGVEAAEFVREWFESAGNLELRTHGPDGRGKYGGWLAEVVRLGDGESLNQALLDEGIAEEYDP